MPHLPSEQTGSKIEHMFYFVKRHMLAVLPGMGQKWRSER